MSKMDKARTLVGNAVEFANVVAAAQSMRDIMNTLDVSYNDPRIWKLLQSAIADQNLSTDHWQGVGTKIQITANDLNVIVQKCHSLSAVIRRLGLKNHGNTSNWLKRLLVRHQIDTSHFVTGHQPGTRFRLTEDQIFTVDSQVARSSLRNHVIRLKLFDYCCVKCGNTGEWQGQLLDLELDHENGISNDNRKENLRWLCPNCHKQTETFGSKKRPTSK